MDVDTEPWRKRVVSVATDVPGLGITALVSLHLSSSPQTQED